MIGIVLVTHGNIGDELLKAVKKKLGLQESGMNARAVAVKKDDPMETSLQQIEKAFEEVDKKRGTVFLTDIFGATPYNLTIKAMPQDKDSADILWGVNLPMLLELAGTPDAVNLRAAVAAAAKAGRDNIGCASHPSELQRHDLAGPSPASSPHT